ncbi:MAG: hypothetical protein ABFR82_03570 [Nitrospirota bacterium]
MRIVLFLLLLSITIIFPVLGCTEQPVKVTELKHFPINSIDEVLTKSGVEIDNEISSDGSGSLRVDASDKTVVRLFEVSNVDVENARLIYQAKVRTENIQGQVYLEMLCGFTGKGEFFSRSMQTPLSGTTDWTTEETPFFLQKGQNPDYVKLNLVVDGKGTAWIDDVRLIKGLLK